MSNEFFISYFDADVDHSADRRYRIKRYCTYLDLKGEHWFEPDLLTYKIHLFTLRLQPSTIKSLIAAVRSGYSELLKNPHTLHQELYKHTDDIPKCVEKMKRAADPRETKFHFEPKKRRHIQLSTYQASELLNAPDIRSFRGLRDAAIFVMIMFMGLRESEIPPLTVADLVLRGREGETGIHVPKAPASSERFVSFFPSFPVQSILKAWLTKTGIKEGPVFRGFFRNERRIRDTPISAQAIEDIFRLYSVYDGEHLVQIKPFDLRLFYARMLYAHGYSLDDISQNLGVQIQTAINYVDVPSKTAETNPTFDEIKLRYIRSIYKGEDDGLIVLKSITFW